MQPLGEAKPELRRRLLAARAARPEAPRRDAGVALRDRLLATGWVPEGTTVAAYESMSAEPGTAPLIDALRALACPVLLPVVTPDMDLDWRHDDSRAELGRDALGLAGIVVVPALAVDRRGVRLGRGAGCYDRALRRVAADVPIVALLYDEEYVDELPEAEHDVRVAAVVTPDRTAGFGWTPGAPVPHD